MKFFLLFFRLKKKIMSVGENGGGPQRRDIYEIEEASPLLEPQQKRGRLSDDDIDEALLQKMAEEANDKDDDESEDEVDLEGLDYFDGENEEAPPPLDVKNYTLRPNVLTNAGRPAARAIDCATEDIVFQHTETTYGVVMDGQVPEIRIWGVTEEENSVCVRVRGFRPYFYAAISSPHEAQSIATRLNVYLSANRKRGKRLDKYVIAYDRTEGRDITKWILNEPMAVMYKFTMALPSHVAAARECLEHANRAVTSRPIKTFEANVPYELRYMIDRRVNGCEWMRLRAAQYAFAKAPITSVQYELEPTHNGAVYPISSTEKGTLAPMRVLAYDIEVKNSSAGFPTPETASIICISAVLGVTGKGIRHRVLFYIGREIPNRKYLEENYELYHCPGGERELLAAFSAYVKQVDPECFTGWNISNFDHPFVAGRAKLLGISASVMNFTRIRDKEAYVRVTQLQSKAYGARKSYELLCEGRFDYDGLNFMYRGIMMKFRSYTLNAIAKDVLGETKLEVHFSQIPQLFDGDDDDRARLFSYCCRDSELALRILEKLMAFINGVEQARVTGVPLKWLLSRGQGVKTFSNMLRFKPAFVHVPSRNIKASLKITGGGYVREPLRKFYNNELIATLDFASLYPSIMQAHNICFMTKLKRSDAIAAGLREGIDFEVPPPAVDAITPEDIAEQDDLKRREALMGIKRKTESKKDRERKEKERSVAGKEPDFCFVKKHIRQGVLPLMLETLVQARSNVKNMMKSVDKKSLEYAVLDGRQLALKVVCNSVYGFLKAFILSDPDLMAAVTAWGRNMVKRVAKYIETNFRDLDVVDCAACRALGMDPEVIPPAGHPDTRPRRRTNAFLVYGDTDSVMVCFGEITLDDCIRIMTRAAKECTALFEKPNELAFESIKLRSLFLNKKRYASLEIEEKRPGEHIRDALARAKLSIKGLEGKRRDNAPLGSELQIAVIKILLKEGNVAKAENLIKQTIEDVLVDRVDMSKYVITKALSKTDAQYKRGKAKQLHVELKWRIAARKMKTGEVEPETGDRVPFVMVAGVTGSKKCEQSESPVRALKEGIPLDVSYYIEKQIWPAVIRIMTCVYEPAMCVVIHSSMTKIERRRLRANQLLFDKSLPHMRQLKQRKQKRSALDGFVVVRPKCMGGCGKPAERNSAVCKTCDERAAYDAAQEELKRRKKKRDDAWDICRQCQGGRFEKVTCANMTCSNFFHRDRTIIDIEDLELRCKNFNISKKQKSVV